MHEIRNYQSPYTADSYWEYLSGEELSLAIFMKVEPSGDWANTLVAHGFTSLDRPVYLAEHDLTFYPSAGLMPSAIEGETGKASNLEVTSVFTFNDITEADVLAGKWNGAKIELWRMNYDVPEMGEEVMFTGILSTITNQQDLFTAELVGTSARLEGNFGENTSRICRKVGTFTQMPGECGYDDETSGGFQNQRVLTVEAVSSRTEIVLERSTDDVPNTFYVNGRMECVTGANEGISREIQSNSGVGTDIITVSLKRPFPLEVESGDTFELTVGCNGTLERCKYFGNVVNRGAEDFIPGWDNATRLRT